ncbi:hypothetical protein [Paenirhodobacter sp. CAU 1674]|uniref:phage head spike fiber domain-containing protein n=1 Tax=Paenirhodobacter sp. CAU 1674 TaxID=3032596 RepID=UPI0023DC2A6E|nr:hypothetical protein [Paenirhodobacter sp. CAU 1674]MDF2143192.1 hypothetical protein [Paenirhodobacter sp. CAU 1674]
MRIGLGLGIAMQKVHPLFIPGLSNANLTGGYAVNCAGSLLAYAANTLRWGCLDGQRAVLVEAGVTNLAMQSDPNPDGVVLYDATVTATLSAVSVTGAALRIARTTTGITNRGYALTSNIASGAVVGSKYCLSAFVRSTGTGAKFQWNAGLQVWMEPSGSIGSSVYGAFNGSAVTSGSIYAGDGWYLLWIAATATGSATAGYIWLHGGGGLWPWNNPVGSSAEYAGAQLEIGAIPTSRIYTSGAAATRAADLVTAPITADVSGGVRVRGTFRMEAVTGGYDRVFQVDDGNNDDRIALYRDTVAGSFKAEVYSAGVSQVVAAYSGAGIGDVLDVDLIFSASGISGTINGDVVSAAGSGGYTPPTIARIGAAVSGSVPARLLCSEFLVTGV